MKQIVKFLSCISAFILLIAACQKRELPIDNIGDPEFFVKCNIGTDSLVLEAGNNGYFMDASCYQNLSKMFVYKADLIQQTGCPGICGYEVTVLLYDSKPTWPGGVSNADSALFLGPRSYENKGEIIERYLVDFAAQRPDAGLFTWKLFEGKNIFTSVSAYTTGVMLDVGKTYSMALSYEDESGLCSVTHTNEYRIGNNLQASIKAARIDPLTESVYNFSCVPSVKNSQNQYSWDFGDGSFAGNVWSTSHNFTVQNDPYSVKMRLINQKDTCFAYYQIPGNPENYCEANYTVSMTAIPDPRLFSSVVLIIKDPSGKVFSSANVSQTLESNFSILSVENYRERNSSGYLTKKLKVSFNCLAADGNSILQLRNGEATIAVAYK
jgi:hypothetical protein